MLRESHPVLTCAEAREREAALFGGEESKEWRAMRRAGRAIAETVLRDFGEIGGFPVDGKILVLAGKGHNAGDALIAAGWILRKFPAARAEVIFAFGERSLRPLARRAWQETLQAAKGRWKRTEQTEPAAADYDLCLDGIFGFQFRPPVDEKTAALIEWVNARSVRLRAAVDLPSADLFRADFTYATGAVKQPVLESRCAGRLRYLDLDFFSDGDGGGQRVLLSRILRPLASLRPAASDKRTYGNVFVLGGSRSYPGAALLAVLAALRSGAGLVTAFVPESLVPAFAARAPEAIWVGWPETPDGGLALEGEHLLRERIERADALVAGPGISREAETQALVKSIVATVKVPVLLDADALQPDIVAAAKTPLVVTPHAGEFARIAGGKELEAFAADTGATVVLKGPMTRVAIGRTVYWSLFGGPVLARGGSGDVLAGLIGGLLAQRPDEPGLAAACGVVWHGLAADELARKKGQVAARTTELIDALPGALYMNIGMEGFAPHHAGDET